MPNDLASNWRRIVKGIIINKPSAIVQYIGARTLLLSAEATQTLFVSWWLYLRHSNVGCIAFVGIAGALFKMALGGPAGTLADRIGGRTVLLICSAVSSVIALLMGIASRTQSDALIYCGVIAYSASTALSKPAMCQLTAYLAQGGNSVRLSSLMRITMDVVTVVIPAGAAFIYERSGLAGVELSVASACCVGWCLIKRVPASAFTVEGTGAESHSGLARLFRTLSPAMRQICVQLIFINCLMSAAALLLMPYAKTQVHTTTEGMASLLTAMVAGSLVAGFVSLWSGVRAPRFEWTPYMVAVVGFWYVGLGVSSGFYTGLAICTVLGFSAGITGIAIECLLREHVPIHSQGLFFGIFQTLNQSVRPISLAACAALTSQFGIRAALVVAGVGISVIAIGPLCVRCAAVPIHRHHAALNIDSERG
jgi:hypothetical protein